jgi:hypothetical protein
MSVHSSEPLSSFDMALNAAALEAASTRWREVVSKVGEDIAGPLTAALNRVAQLTQTGKIDRQSLKALRCEIEKARHVGMVSQQLARWTQQSMPQTPEPLPLAEIFKEAMALRRADLQDRGLVVRPALSQGRLEIDPELIFALFNACLDWAMEHACGAIDVRMQDLGLAEHLPEADLRMEWQFKKQRDVSHTENLNWVLLSQIADAMNVQIQHSEADDIVSLVLDFFAHANANANANANVDVDSGVNAN